jgi:23S rRNA U2552 (ribose-2'-O)-methylase RlmE/FtsJ
MQNNHLFDYFNNNQKRLIHKWEHYFDIYKTHFSRFCGQSPKILEIGISHGGSLQMWKDYFGEGCEIYGLDIDPICKTLEEPGIEIFIGSQSDRDFLRDFKNKIGQVDILIDDGGHLMNQQIITFEELFDIVQENGVYLCEDLHTSYWSEYGGGLRRNESFIEYSKNFIDYINSYHWRETTYVDGKPFADSVKSISYYDSVLVIEKQRKLPLSVRMTGNSSW